MLFYYAKVQLYFEVTKLFRNFAEEFMNLRMEKELLEYFNGDTLASDVWKSKYQVKKDDGEPLEKTPKEMHLRMAKEFARIELKRKKSKVTDKEMTSLSKFGRILELTRITQSEEKITNGIFKLFDRFEKIIPQGSIMSMLGHPTKVGSLSNCFVIPAPYDSYGGIMKTDEQQVQLMKRRGGVGTNLNTLRPNKTIVSNAAGTSTGVVSFMERYSNSTREVGQDGRRGALMLLLSILHPEIFGFVQAKKDRTKVTGANVSVMITDEFMGKVESNSDFLCRFPVTLNVDKVNVEELEYNKLTSLSKGEYVMRIKAKELFDLIIQNAWENAEPGIAFMDRVLDYSPDGVYEQFKAIASNPCGEQWLQAYDSCRLLAMNLFSIVRNPFTKEASIDYTELYNIAYLQQRLADDLVDLEIEYVDRIINKIKKDPEPDEVKRTELELWENVKKTAQAGRRTGCGFTGLGDMLAALGLKYDSDEALDVIEKVMHTKMEAELDCTIDLAITRGPFEGWKSSKEYHDVKNTITGTNEFYKTLLTEFPEQIHRMLQYGRRNVSWSTVAPTGSVSILTRTTSGIEPLFEPYYTRRKKINPSDKNSRVDFVDEKGDHWQEFYVLHPKFEDWFFMNYSKDDYGDKLGGYSKDVLNAMFKKSPWYGSTANELDWNKRVLIQSIVQKYTTNAISSTINLPNNVTKEEVANIYLSAYKLGLKGITAYRDGCRTGVLIKDSPKVKEVAFSHKEAAKRPKSLDCEIDTVKVKGNDYTVIIGLLEEKPYEVFAFEGTLENTSKSGRITKFGKGNYNISYKQDDIPHTDLDFTKGVSDEQAAITRLISTSLRHGTEVKYIVEQLNKTHGSIVSFSKAISRVLKGYIPNDAKSSATCGNCGSNEIVFSEGCSVCKSCGDSKCG